MLQFRGDRITFILTVQPAIPGKAYVRTNLGHARIMRREIIRQVEFNEPRLGRDWFDVPMQATGPGRYEATIGLDEVGHFEAKCLFLPDGQSEPLWPSGHNTAINVEPADTVCGNIIYNAFVRQFRPNKNLPRSDYSATDQAVKLLDQSHFTVIPASGTFRDMIAELDFIIDRLGCRFIQLLPIHPTPTTYGRMGRFGSPYASLSFTAVDPALAVFDPKATPLDQFLELVDAVHARRGKLIIDIAINHTGWAANLHETHPQWLARNEDGTIENPGAWGVVWEDLTRLDFSHKDMWPYMADVFLTWCRRGVDGFRCDAGYMVPVATWRYIIAKVREQYPDTIFFLEGLGGKISVTRDLLNRANFNWAYSELFQNYDRRQIEWYLPGTHEICKSDGITVHFAETHDNNRLAATSTTYARMRTALSALLSPYGAFAFANGVEWLATEKLNVHEACALNWGAPENQVDAMVRLNRLLKTHPVFHHPVELKLIQQGDGNFIAMRRLHRPSGRWVVVLANLDWQRPVKAGWSRREADFGNAEARDLLSGVPIQISTGGETHGVDLSPGQVLCLAEANPSWPETIDGYAGQIVPAIDNQLLKAKALEVMHALNTPELMDTDEAVALLCADPEEYCRKLNPHSPSSRVITWCHPHDLRRQVMVPPGHFVLLRADHPFQARLTNGRHVLAIEHSLQDRDGRAFILLIPQDTPDEACLRRLEITRYTDRGTIHCRGDLLYLATGRRARVRTEFGRSESQENPLLVLSTNGRGAMLRAHADWRRLESRYDALLAANLNPHFPEDRQIMLTRCRAWVVYQGFSQEINPDCLESFGFSYEHGAFWRYLIPTGQGQHIVLQITAGMVHEEPNHIQIHVQRLSGATDRDELADDQPVTVIIRPDIEDRNFHHTTKAYTGPEHHWHNAVTQIEKGFVFAPAHDRCLTMLVDRGRFVIEPEWYYMVRRPLEAQRGLDPYSDLFGPGYFSSPLAGGAGLTLSARVVSGNETAPRFSARQGWTPEPDLPLLPALHAALDQYVVRRGEFRTVIAGYPWFLDWGRDTLIAARGLVAAGRIDTVKAVLMQFARFEQQGTIPNMIRGGDATNRDTSDAPLWLFTVCADLVAAEDSDAFLESDCNGRSLRQVLIDMANSLCSGTPNGMTMDPESGLIFSPAHFTWMDTNYPAGTPRRGYPIEIQALWWAALDFLARVDQTRNDRWRSMADQVQHAIHALFWDPDMGWLVDCRHAEDGQSAAQARPDDALRPNQLLAITLGAVDDPRICRKVLKACQMLLVPGAIRSLADRPVRIPLEVRHHDRLLNNPTEPYWGTYSGDEDTHRKAAYHNGTAWTWLFPSFCEAWAACHGPAEYDTALAWLSSSIRLINSHCVGQVPEIVDGDAPHHQRGCDAQAWGVSELLRVWKKLVEHADGRD